MATHRLATASGLAQLVKAAIAADTDGLKTAIKAEAQGPAGAKGDKGDAGPAGPAGSSVPRESVTAASPHGDAFPYLPARAPLGGLVRTINAIQVDSSTAYPRMLTWTEPSLLYIEVRNPAGSGTDINIGTGAYGSLNHTTEPDVVPPGSSWISTGGLPVFCRTSTAGAIIRVDVITVRSS